GYNLAHFFIAPLYPLFLLSRGLDVFRMNVVLATYMITVFVFEVPTGALADVVGRRFTFVTGCLVRAVAYAIYTRAPRLGDCLRAELVDALGTTFVSGALDAWVVDGMRDAGHRGPMDAVFARGNTITRAVMMGGAVVAGYLADRSLETPWLVAAATFVVVGVVGGALMRDGARPAGAPGPRPAVAGLALVRRSPVLSLLCALTLCGASAALPVYMLFPPRLRALGAEHLHVMGWVIAAINVAGLAASAAVPRLLKRVRRESVLAA